MFCTGLDCPAQLSRHLVYFASRAAMDIAGLGSATVEALMDHGYLKSIADIYKLFSRRAELINQGIVGRQRSVDNLLAQIEKSKQNPLYQLLSGLGIPGVGRQTARNIATAMGSMEKLCEAETEKLLQIPDVGKITADNLYKFFRQDQNRHLLEELAAAGVRMFDEEPVLLRLHCQI